LTIKLDFDWFIFLKDSKQNKPPYIFSKTFTVILFWKRIFFDFFFFIVKYKNQKLLLILFTSVEWQQDAGKTGLLRKVIQSSGLLKPQHLNLKLNRSIIIRMDAFEILNKKDSLSAWSHLFLNVGYKRPWRWIIWKE
jgi:hypothetical protein